MQPDEKSPPTPDEARPRFWITIAIVVGCLPAVLYGVRRLTPMVLALLSPKPLPVVPISAVAVRMSYSPTSKVTLHTKGKKTKVELTLGNTGNCRIDPITLERLLIDGVTPASKPKFIAPLLPHSSVTYSFTVNQVFNSRSGANVEVGISYHSSDGSNGSYSEAGMVLPK